MKDLKCSLKECTYNQGFCCIANQISVDNTAHCDSFQLSQKKLADKIFEIGAESCKPNYNVDTKVSCTAACLFNSRDICTANGITVLGDSDFATRDLSADCATFTPKK